MIRLPRARRPGAILLMAGLVAAAVAAPSPPFVPLHERIDRMIEGTFVGPVLGVAADADFVRRIHLDLTGRIPSAEEARAFLSDTSPDKRPRLVDRLVGSRDFARHMATTFDVMFMERRPEKSAKAADWQQWLFESFATNKPYHQLAQEILSADGTEAKNRVASRFFLDRDAESNLLTRDTGRIFFGKDLQCAQCHDHPRVDDFLQRDYHGLYAFFSRAYLFTEDRSKKVFLAEKADGDVAFTSVFTKESGATRPRPPGGLQMAEPRFRMGDEWVVRPDAKDKNLRPVPKHSRVALLAAATTDGSNRDFNRNIANRIWAAMMGRGLVDPVDEMHSDNPPAYPALLDLLANEIVTMKFDVRSFVRELALTRAYQRSIEIATVPALPARQTAGRIADLEAERTRLSEWLLKHDEAHKAALTNLAAARKEAAPLVADFAKTNAALLEVKKACDPAINAHYEAQRILLSRRDALQSINEGLARVQAALANLPGDKDLTNSIASLTARSASLTKDVEAAAKDADTKAAAARPMFDGLAAADSAADSIRERHDAVERQILALEAGLTSMLARRQADRTLLRHVERQLADAKALVESEPLFALASASLAELEALRGRERRAREIVATYDALVAAQRADDTADRELRESRRQLAEAVSPPRGCTPATAGELAKLRRVVASREAAVTIATMRLAQARRGFEPVARQFADANRDLPAIEKQRAAASAKAEADRRKLGEPFVKLSPMLENRFASGALVALTPEQLCWSMMQASGQVRAQELAADAEFEKKDPATESNKDSPARLAARATFLEQFVWDRLRGNAGQFASLFANGAGQPQNAFYTTAEQALFFNNGGLVRGWLAPSAGNLTDRLLKAADAQSLCDELYMSVLTRPPTADEVKEVSRRLGARAGDKPAVVQDLAWALLTSVEFRFKH